MKLFISENIVLEEEIINGGILLKDGIIVSIIKRNDIATVKQTDKELQVIDVGTSVLMAGIVDSHVHVNEPGRTHWEGFETATKAAAAGGITTIVDMPLNSIPPTTTLENLKTKVNAAKGKTYVDVAFWGGVVPGNQEELLGMIKAGVVGFKCFMCPSGVDEFENVTADDIEMAMQKMENTNSVLAFHAEIDQCISPSECPPTKYKSFLKSRPSSMEQSAIKVIIDLSKKYKVRTHIVHLSASEALPLIKTARSTHGITLTVETCHHYLNLTAEEVPAKGTQFKCCPPIRNDVNKELLWRALVDDGLIDMVVSDHSPCTPDLKLLNCKENEGDFLKAWGGISSVQFGLSLFWTQCKKRSLPIFYINKYMSRATAELVGLHTKKGRIAINYDADFVIWSPEEEIIIEPSMIFHKNKITPYMGTRLFGKVLKTIVGGNIVFENGRHSAPTGKLLINV